MNVEPGATTSVLSLRLDPEAGPGLARLELAEGDQPLNYLHVGLAELGLGQASSPYETRDPAAGAAPRRAVDAITSVVAPHVGPERPLYLRFGRPSGGLPMLPWERWLASALDAPIVRWPYLPARSAPAREPLAIAICGSVPRAKEEFRLADLVRSSVRQLADLGRRARFHVFVDAERERELRSRLGAQAEGEEIRVVRAAGAEGLGTASRARGFEDEESSLIESPWLRWLLAEAPPRLDLVLFLCHGYLANGRGSLAFAESPLENRDRRWSRFVGRGQLVSFLDACGARALALSSPPGNWSVAGLLALADEVARNRPGPVVCHDFQGDPGGDALGGALSAVLAPSRASWLFQPSPALAVYASVDLLDPAAVAEPRVTAASQRMKSILRAEDAGGWDEDMFLTTRSLGEPERDADDALAELSSAAGSLRWEAASRRVLERYASSVAGQGEVQSDLGRAAQEGREKALRLIADLVRESKE